MDLKWGVPSAETSRSVQGLGKGVSGKPYPRLSNTRRPRFEPRTFRSQAVRLYRLHQARPSQYSTRARQFMLPILFSQDRFKWFMLIDLFSQLTLANS